MKVNFEFKKRKMFVILSTGDKFLVELNLISLFLIANLFCTITWLVPQAHKNTWITDLQMHLDMAEETEFEHSNLNKDA